MNQKLHLITATKKDYSEVLKYILLSKENVVVTNAHALVRHDPNEIFDDEFVKSIPDGEWLLSADAAKEMNRFPYHIENKSLIVNGKSKMVYDLIKNDTDGLKFPNWEAVIPETFDEKLNEIGVNPKLLDDLHKAIDPSTTGVKLSFNREMNAVKVTALSSDLCNYKAIIMPLMLD